jgi:hypothetical protein
VLPGFEDASNHRTEILSFEVVDFFGPYHIILGSPCYVKFMAIPSYAYLKLKIPGPPGIITVEAKAQRALDYKQVSFELVMVEVTITKLKEHCLSALPSRTNPTMPSTSGTFNAAEDNKVVRIDAEDPTKTIQLGAGMGPK